MQNKVNFFLNNSLHNTPTDLCQIMNRNGSDKGSGHHNYTTFYRFIFNEIREKNLNVFELGLGTNDLRIPSNMSGMGVPCGSLRGWREYFSNSNIFGADVDDKILIQEERIKTFYCDQTNSSCISNMWNTIGKEFDIIIEDGLHTFEANKTFFENSIAFLKPGGFFIVEDIDYRYHSHFSKFIEENHRNFNYMELIKIPNPKNMSDNNIMLVVK